MSFIFHNLSLLFSTVCPAEGAFYAPFYPGTQPLLVHCSNDLFKTPLKTPAGPAGEFDL
jgi:hypothetical protein